MKVHIFKTSLIDGVEVEQEPKDWYYDGAPQTPVLSDGNQYAYHPAGIGGPQLLGDTDDHERQSESDENWVQANGPAALLDRATKRKIGELKVEGLSRMNAVMEMPFDFDEMEFYTELWKSIDITARQPTVKFQQIIDIYVAGKQAVQAVKAMTVEADVVSYDVVNTPVWP